MAWCKKIFSIQINILQRKFQILIRKNKFRINYSLIITNDGIFFSRDEKEIFIDGKPTQNFLKNHFNKEYTIDINDFKFVSEKGFFHIFGELFTSEISFVRNDAPDKTACALSLGKEAGKSTCPEQDSFQNRYFLLKTYEN